MEKHVKSALSLAAAVLFVSIGLESFLVPNEFIDGGVTGLSMLAARVTGVPLAVWLVAVNAPFVWMGYRQIGGAFAARAAGAIAVLALALWLVPLPVATNDKLLGAVFGGGFVGAGVGLAIRGGGVLDGTEILAVVLSKRTFATVGEVILGLNVLIFGAAALLLGVEPALYSMLTYFAASKTIDYLLHGLEAYQGICIVSPQSEAIRQAILNDLGRGVTSFAAKGGFTSTAQQVLFCVVTRLEVKKIESIVAAHDPQAFVVIAPVQDTSGGVVKRRSFH